ncbi:MAG: adenylate/guanylate cyclase domain-containing protein, partial [Pseudomonadota bacterium]
MSGDISAWLREVGLAQFEAAFVENDIDLALVESLTAEDLKELGITKIGDRKRFENAVAVLEQADVPASPSDGPADDADYIPEGARRQVTVLFADIAGFTDLSHRLDAEETHALLNDFFATADQIIAQHGGTVDKHIGDAVMAVFGAPLAHTDDPQRAVRAACALHNAVDDLPTPVKVHIGVASGRVVASATGSSQHQRYTVTGDSVNLAARLTDLAGSGQTLISASVRRALGRRFGGEGLGERLIGGLPEPLEVWRVERLYEGTEAAGPFVGRRAELDQFSAYLRACRSGSSGGVLILRGEPGIGKTRLTDKFASIALEQGAAVHRGTVLDFGTGKGQDAIRSLIRSLLDIPQGGDRRTRAAAATDAMAAGLLREERAPFINDLLDLPQPNAVRGIYDAMENALRNQGKCEALDELCIGLAERCPLVLCIEDLHWADDIVLNHATSLARITAIHPIILVLSTRLSGDPFDRQWQTLCGNAQLTTIDLSPLGKRDAVELARHFEAIESTRLAAYVERAAGNPLLLEQLLLNADEAAEQNLPGSVQTIVQARVDALPHRERETLQAAAVLGQRFSDAQVSSLMEERPFRPDMLISHGLISGEGPWYRFSHALIRDGVYETLLRGRRTSLHRKAADVFRDLDPELYARHLDEAEDDAAAGAYLAAGRLQREKFRLESALNLTTRASELPTDDALRFEILCFLGEILRDLGRSGDSLDPYAEARRIAPDDAARCRAELGLAASLRIVDRLEDALACLGRAEEIANRGPLDGMLADVRFLRGNLYFPLGRIAECLIEHEASLSHARKAGSREAEARAMGGLGDAHYVGGRMVTASEYFSRCVELARDLDLRRVEVANLPMKGWCEMFLLRLDDAETSAQLAVAEAVEIG